MRVPRIALAALVAASVAVLSACGAGSPDADPADTSPPDEATSALSGELTIYAAASLRTAFDRLAEDFEAANPGVDVLPIVYDGSSTLATQLVEGASADVFASADENNMQTVLDDGLASSADLFATNTLVIAVPTGNPGGVEGLEDLADDSLTVVLCAPEVPCGAASQTLLAGAGLDVTPASLEQNVTAVLTKVAADEADAGLVYATDASGEPAVEAIVPEGADEVVNRYPITALSGSANPDAAAAFVAFVLGPQGQAVLAELGFGGP